MSTATIARPTHFLDEAMLSRFRERAPGYDRENRFFHEDFEELRSAGYLKFAVPKHHGGSGQQGNLNRSRVQCAELPRGCPDLVVAARDCRRCAQRGVRRPLPLKRSPAEIVFDACTH